MHVPGILEVQINGRHKPRSLRFSSLRSKVDMDVCGRGLCLRSLGGLRVTDVGSIGDYFVTAGDPENEGFDFSAVD